MASTGILTHRIYLIYWMIDKFEGIGKLGSWFAKTFGG